MKEYPTDKIRNVALASHAAVGKTTLAEAFLKTTNILNRMGTVDDGSTVSDYHHDEIERKFSISTSLLHCELNDVKINIIDTPGYPDFIGEVHGAARVAETAVILLNATAGVEVGTDAVQKVVSSQDVACVYFANRCDKEHADLNKVVTQLRETQGNGVISVQIAVNAGEDFNQIIDLISMKAHSYDSEGNVTVGEIPQNLQEAAASAREQLMESVAEADDDLLEKFFDAGELTDEEFRTGLRAGVRTGAIKPVLCGAAVMAAGADLLLEFIANYCPSPADTEAVTARIGDNEVELTSDSSGKLAALVFKTISERHLGELTFFRVYSGNMTSGSEVWNTSRDASEKIGQMYVLNGKQRTNVSTLHAGDIAAAVKLKNTHTGDTLATRSEPCKLEPVAFPPPVIRVAIEAKSKGDEDKISSGLAALHEEDPTFVVTVDPELHQTILSGQGELHLDIIVKRLQEKYGVEVELLEPKIPLRETIRGATEGQYKFKKQTGGRGQYGDVHLKLEPLPSGEGFEFVDNIVGGVVPGKFIPAVEKGVREAMEDGVIAGFPVVDVKVTLYDGSYHNVDSSDMAFKIAASMGFKKLFREARPALQEPIYEVEIRVPEEFMGDVMGDVSSRRGKILGMEADGHFQVIRAHIPLAELYKYSTKLRSLTQGRGIHRRKFANYADVPNDIQQKIMKEYEEARAAQ